MRSHSDSKEPVIFDSPDSSPSPSEAEESSEIISLEEYLEIGREAPIDGKILLNQGY